MEIWKLIRVAQGKFERPGSIIKAQNTQGAGQVARLAQKCQRIRTRAQPNIPNHELIRLLLHPLPHF